MKPRNIRQREIVTLWTTLPPISDKQKRWAYDHGPKLKAFLCKGEAWCSACGGIIDAPTISPLGATLLGETIICPHCGKKLKVENSRRRKNEEKWYFTILTTCRGYQVCRNFSVKKFIRRGDSPYYDIDEVVQNWISEDGHEEVIARPVASIMGYYDVWQTDKPMDLRNARRRDPYMPDKYRIGGAWIYPVRRLLPLVKRNGYTGRNQSGIPESEHIIMLLTDPEAEWLEKTGQYGLFHLKYARPEALRQYQHAIRVANRAGYKIKDGSMWVDYLSLLEYFHLDTHNAHYVCPRNLKAEHDRLLKRKEKIEAKLEREKKIREAAKWEKKYRADKAKYFGICFGNDDIMITVMQSVADIAEEGLAMHHCVYQAGYYKKASSLILSARDISGKRLETIEVDLKSFRVVQSRAKCNGVSPRHDEILDLMQKNMYLIRTAAGA